MDDEVLPPDTEPSEKPSKPLSNSERQKRWREKHFLRKSDPAYRQAQAEKTRAFWAEKKASASKSPSDPVGGGTEPSITDEPSSPTKPPEIIPVSASGSMPSSMTSSGNDPDPSLLAPYRRIQSREELNALVEQMGQELLEFGRIRDKYILSILNTNQEHRKNKPGVCTYFEDLFQAAKAAAIAMHGEDRQAIAHTLGIAPSKVSVMLKKRGNFTDPRLTEHQIQKEIEVQETIYTGRKDLIERLLEGGARYVEQALLTVDKTKGEGSAKAAAILIDKALLLAGQPTSRISRVDERMMSTEDLQSKAREYDEMVARTKLKVVNGGDQAS